MGNFLLIMKKCLHHSATSVAHGRLATAVVPLLAITS
jgi:hypothetical protein